MVNGFIVICKAKDLKGKLIELLEGGQSTMNIENSYDFYAELEPLILEKISSVKEGEKFCRKHYGIESDLLVKTVDLTYDQWLGARRFGIGGTDVSAIVGINKYKSKAKVYLEKTTGIYQQEENEKMYFGKVLKDIVVKEFLSKNPKLKVKKINGILKSLELPIAIGNIDRIINNKNGERGVLVVKTVSEYMKGYWAEDEVPIEYMVQLQWYMYITKVNYGYFAALIGGNKYIQKYVKRDNELIEMLVNQVKDFWYNNVVKLEAPRVDGSDASTKLLNELYPRSNFKEIELKEEALDIIKVREELKLDVKALEYKINQCDNVLKDMLKDNEIGVIEDRRVLWKTFERASINTKALKEEHLDIYNKYLKTTSYRKFEIK